MNIEKLKEEFAGKTNHAAYDLAFSKRLMRQDPAHPGTFLGNTQRQEFIPALNRLLQTLPPHPKIVDIGAGGGGTIDAALKNLQSATINFIEPNPVLIASYEERLAVYPYLSKGIAHCGPLEDYYANDGRAPIPDGPQDLALCIHVLYHHTDPRAANPNPDNDILQAVRTMLNFLKPQGSLFLVLANQLYSTTGKAGRYYFEKTGHPEIARNLLEIAQSRHRLLADGEITSLLREQNIETEFYSEPSSSYIYGECAEDIVAMCITAEIGEVNDAPFDVQKFDICAEFIQSNPDAIGLTVEERDVPHKGMVRSNQPQMISTFKRKN